MEYKRITWKQSAIARKRAAAIIKSVRKLLKDKYTFADRMVGSGALGTMVKDENRYFNENIGYVNFLRNRVSHNKIILTSNSKGKNLGEILHIFYNCLPHDYRMGLKSDINIMSIKVNGVELDYATINISGGTEAGFKTIFKDFDISTSFDLKSGENTIELQVVPNETAKYVTTAGADGGAPSIDCLKIKSSSTLTWNSLWEDNKASLGI